MKWIFSQILFATTESSVARVSAPNMTPSWGSGGGAVGLVPTSRFPPPLQAAPSQLPAYLEHKACNGGPGLACVRDPEPREGALQGCISGNGEERPRFQFFWDPHHIHHLCPGFPHLLGVNLGTQVVQHTYLTPLSPPGILKILGCSLPETLAEGHRQLGNQPFPPSPLTVLEGEAPLGL